MLMLLSVMFFLLIITCISSKLNLNVVLWLFRISRGDLHG